MKASFKIHQQIWLPLFFFIAALLSPAFSHASDGSDQADAINKEAGEVADGWDNSKARDLVKKDFADAVKKLGEDNPNDADAVKKGACKKLEEMMKEQKNNKEIQKLLKALKDKLRELKLIDCGGNDRLGGNPNNSNQNQSPNSNVLQGSQPSTTAALDYFLKIEGVDGTAASTGNSKWLEVYSCQLGALSPSNIAAGSTGRITAQDFHFSFKPMDSSSPQLMLACASGQHIPSAILICRKAGSDQQNYFQYEMENCMISSFSGSSSSDRPMESLSLNFTKITYSTVLDGQKKVIYQGGR